MSDPSKNPNSDPERRRELQRELTFKLTDLLKEEGLKIAVVAEDVPTFFMALHSSFAVSMLTLQALTTEDPSTTVDEHMRSQFIAVKAAFKGLAEKNSAIWHEPPRLDRGTK